MQCNAIKCNAMQGKIMQGKATHFNAMQGKARQGKTTRCDAMQCNAIITNNVTLQMSVEMQCNYHDCIRVKQEKIHSSFCVHHV